MIEAEYGREISDIRDHVGELEDQNEEAQRLINAAVEIMTKEQVSQWSGVRAWLEEVK